MSQEIMDHNDNVFVTAYNVRWYLASLHTQRMILFLLQRGNKIFKLSIGGMIIGSLENFASVRYLIEELQRICDELKNENEIAIIKEYGSNAKSYTTAITCKGQHDAICSKYLFIFELFEMDEIINKHKTNKHLIFYKNKGAAIYTTISF
ncbi:PREDICTED: uncharacterized protein LOC106746667 [Dinoponera quadriceps]|uniref:Uncharacterized protein LOC106746667 n=1 Tax=Dinoponera quadriceps TaxID=609295 RepID=A0A6P3XKM0_DINQU|nr:PREDICTED: uncharacterized protein LOC106746667 [Dinoponera quadriceps]